MDFDSDTNQELLRYLIVIVSAPVWVPFGTALFRELLRALRPDGGLYGQATSPRQRAAIEKELAREEDPLVHEPIANLRKPLAPRAGGNRRSVAPSQAKRPSQTRPGGFR